MTNYYQLLGVSKHASQMEIKQAYRKLALEFHPDQAKSVDTEIAEEKFKEINQAYSVLSDKQKRIQYDRFGRVQSGSTFRGHGVQFTSFNGGQSKRSIIENKLDKRDNFDYVSFASVLDVKPKNLLKIIKKLMEKQNVEIAIENTKVIFP